MLAEIYRTDLWIEVLMRAFPPQRPLVIVHDLCDRRSNAPTWRMRTIEERSQRVVLIAYLPPLTLQQRCDRLLHRLGEVDPTSFLSRSRRRHPAQEDRAKPFGKAIQDKASLRAIAENGTTTIILTYEDKAPSALFPIVDIEGRGLFPLQYPEIAPALRLHRLQEVVG